MNNFQKSLEELFRVNHQAGVLRSILIAAVCFVLWSLLATISVSFVPNGSLDFRNILGVHSDNLALSLFLDIISAYFSIFSFSLFIIFLLTVFLTFEMIAEFNMNLRSLPSLIISKNFLTSCAFSFPKRKTLLIPDDLNNFNKENLFGPLEAVVKPGYALLVKNRNNYSVKFNDQAISEGVKISITFSERVIGCFNLKPSSLSIKNEQVFSKSISAELTYRFDLPADNSSSVNFAAMLALFDPGDFRKIIECTLKAETKIALNQFFRNSSGISAFTSDRIVGEPINIYEKYPEKLVRKKYSRFPDFYNKDNRYGIKRNRKRPIYLSPRHETAAIKDVFKANLTPTMTEIINEILAKNLQKTLFSIFGTNFVITQITHMKEEEGSKWKK